MTPILGKDALISFQGGSGWVPYGCAETFSLKTTTETKSVKTVGDGAHKKTAPQIEGYTISLSGIVLLDSGFGFFDLLDNQNQFLRVAWQILCSDSVGNVKRIEGQATITDTNFDGPSTDFVTGSIELEGFGAYQKYNNNGICASVISDATIVILTGLTSGITFIANSDTEYISYNIYKDDVLTYSGTVYKTAFYGHHAMGASAFHYRVEATPYCITDVAGAAFTKQF